MVAVFQFKEVAADERVIEAERVSTDGANVYFERFLDGRWRTELSVPAERLERLQRQSGHERKWVPVRPQPVAD